MGTLLTTASTLQCPHGGRVVPVGHPAVKAGGAPVLLAATPLVVTGCPQASGPGPCVKVRWVAGSAAVATAAGATVSSTSVGVCEAASGVPQGPVVVVSAAAPVEAR